MKTASIFDLSRPVMFQQHLDKATSILRGKLKAGNNRGSSYVGGATRKAFRALARAEARLAMKTYRRTERERQGVKP